MFLGSENLVSIHIFIKHPAHILVITILILIMMIVLMNVWRIMTTFCLPLRIMRELTLALILALSVIQKMALNYLPAASIVRDIITVCINFYYASFVRLCLNPFLFSYIYFSRLEVLVYVPLHMYFSLSVLNDR